MKLLWALCLTAAALAQGTLVIVGGGKIGPDISSRMIALAGGTDAPWVVIPTAGEKETYDAKTAEGGFLAAAGVGNITMLHTRNRKVADSEEFVAPLKTARGVWITGGRQWRLVDSYLNTRTQRELEALLKRGGVIGGSSAGATIMGSYLVRGAREGNAIMMAKGYEEGFGFMRPVAIDQHVTARNREKDLVPVIAAHPELLGIGLDESTAIVVQGSRFEVVGPGKVFLHQAAKPSQTLSAGDRHELKAQTVPVRPGTLPAIPRHEVRRAATRIVVDGKLDDVPWKGAQPVEFQFPWDYQTGAKQKTTARMLWDDENLYVGYECEDADIVAHFLNRDDPTYRDDAVEIFINPDPTQLTYYGLEMNARATLFDYFYAFGSVLLKRFNLSGVELATNILGTLNQTGDKDSGWTLELAIPWTDFKELRRDKTAAPAAGETWRVNLNRWDGTEPARRLSQWSDSGMAKANPHNPERFGYFVFVK